MGHWLWRERYRERERDYFKKISQIFPVRVSAHSPPVVRQTNSKLQAGFKNQNLPHLPTCHTPYIIKETVKDPSQCMNMRN